MSKTYRRIVIAAVAYFLIAAFTYGYAHRLEVRRGRQDAEIGGFILAAMWPIFWPFHLSRLAWQES